ncbi:UL16-binding protein 6-like [Tupaia chinensis]|uniref:UL16-binding protein 6-like n=1 Tax=Tupaia chinensis TaxID=246437 RepID=UPI0003C91650|nr:UL16-binding protein 6-like [Tupaia chinensis]
MTRVAEPGILLCVALLLLLPGRTWARRADTHALCYDFTLIPSPRPGQGWCEVQGQVDWKVFLSYDCGSKVKPISPLGKKVNGTRAWEDQVIMLRDAGEIFKERLPDIKLEDDGNRGSLPLQARMSCKCDASGHTTGAWQFSFDGQTFLLFDPEKRMWTAVHHTAGGMKEQWENDREMAMFLEKVSLGDGGSWLEEFLKCWEEVLEPTAPPTTAPDTAHAHATANGARPWSFPVSLTISVLLCIFWIF